MPVNVEYTTTLEQVHEFLWNAAYDGKFRQKLRKLTPDELQAMLSEDFGVTVDSTDIPDPPRTLPTRAQCQELIRMFGLHAAHDYAKAQYAQSSTSRLAPLILVIGHAMPLVATVDGEVAAAG